MKKLLTTMFVALLLVGCGEEAVVGKWDEWGANPEPYGGLEVLAKIKRAAEGRWERHDDEFGLRDSNITDISPLAGFTNLGWLDLADNQISDLSPLAGLTKLEVLFLGDNNITDISPLAGLTKLRTLHLPDNQISDLSPLKGLTELEKLLLHRNEITDISPLKGLTKLRYLTVDGHPIPEEQKAMLRKALPNCEIEF